MTVCLVAVGDAAVERHRMGWPTPRPQPPVHLLGATDLVFGMRGNSAGLLGDGWSAQEDGYCWAVGPRCTLSVPIPARLSGAYRLEIELAPFTAGAALPKQRLAGTVNGWHFSAPMLEMLSVLEIIVPAGVVAGQPVIEMILEVPDAARPCDVLGGTDDRTLGFSFRRLRLDAVADDGVATVFGPVADISGPTDDRELMLRFESLGENCEFGLAQRRAGAEPLGLLRFASAPLPYLLTALAAGFRGMGAPGSVTVTLGGDGQEFMVRDDVYGLLYHAGAGTDPVRIAARETQRMRFLIDKLLGDITAGDKIFVFHAVKNVRRRAADLLAAAMAQFGTAPLLWVEPANAEFPCGTVQRLSETMFIGHLGRFASADNAHDLDFPGWRRLCRTCLVARDGG